MSHRQLADQEGHRWDVEDEGPLDAQQGAETDGDTAHQLRFTRDDGAEAVRHAPHPLDYLADVELRSLLVGDEMPPERGPDTEANRTGGYGDARS